MESDYAARGNRLAEALAARVAERDAALARAEAAEARVAEAERLLRRLRNEVNGCVLKLEPWSIREVIGNTNFAALEQKAAAADAFLAGAPAAPPDALRDFAVVVAAKTPPEYSDECPLCYGTLQHDARRLLGGDEACAADYRKAAHIEELAALRREEASDG